MIALPRPILRFARRIGFGRSRAAALRCLKLVEREILIAEIATRKRQHKATAARQKRLIRLTAELL